MKEAIYVCIAANQPALVTGDPGTGKTSFFQLAAQDHGAHLETVLASLRDPTDIGGLPIKTKDDNVRFAPPDWATRLVEASEAGQDAWLFFDEISTAAPAVQAALLRVICEGVVGDLELPSNVRRIAAMNPTEQAAGGYDLKPPLANRFVHLDWRVTAGEWVTGMLEGFRNPPPLQLTKGWDAQTFKYRSLIGSFVRTRPELHNAIPKEESKQSGAWPSSRTWDMTATLLAAHEASGYDDEVKVTLIAGCVGEGAAMELIQWISNMDLPNPEELLKDPDSYEIPDRSDKVFAVTSSIAATVIGRGVKNQDWVNGWKILSKTATGGHADVASPAAKALMLHKKPGLPEIRNYLRPFIDMFQDAGLIPDA